MKIKEGLSLLPYQEEGVNFLMSKTKGLIASEPGLGKTVQLIVAANNLLPDKVSVLCPKSMVLTWKKEIAKWGDFRIKWFVTNYEKLLTKTGAEDIKAGGCVLVCDESHVCIKNPNCKRAKELFSITGKYKRVWLSTATPASRSGFDYYGTLQMLGRYTDKNQWWFKEMFCNKVANRFTPKGFTYEGFKNVDVLKNVFKEVAIKHKKSEVATQLPSKTISNFYVDTGEVWSADNEFLLKCLEEGKPIPEGYQAELQAIGAKMVDVVAEWLEQFSDKEPIVVFAWHKSVIDILVKKITSFRSVGKITGDTEVNERQKHIDDFQSKKISTLVVNIQSGGVGITLTAACNACYVQPPMSYIHLKQSEDRVHRIGSNRPVTITRFIAEGSVVGKMYEVLDERALEISKVGV